MQMEKPFALLWAVVATAMVLVTCDRGGLRAAPPSETPSTAEFRNDFQVPDRLMSDGMGLYVHGVDQVKAVFDARGDFDLDTNSSGRPALRRLVLDFTAVAGCPAAGCRPPFATSAEEAYMSTGAGGLLNMPIGSIRTKLAVNFFPGGDLQWFLRFDPSQYPDTSNVLVTRLDANTWTIEAASTDVAKLLSAPTKGKLVLTERGNFFMPFKVVVRRK